MKVEHTVLFSAETIQEEVCRLAARIDAGSVDSFVVVTVLRGAAIFSSDLVRMMKTETELTYISASSYLEDFKAAGSVTINQEAELDAQDRHVLIVEDIIDTGRTLKVIAAAVAEKAPRSVSTVALVNKTGRRATDYEATYTGFDITHEFIYGYGLDWNEQFRHLPYLAIANPETIITQALVAPPG